MKYTALKPLAISCITTGVARGLRVAGWLVIVAATVGWAGAARADLLTYDLTGTITNVDDTAFLGPPFNQGAPPIHLLDGLVAPGDRFHVALTFDPGDGFSLFVPYDLTIATPSFGYEKSSGQMGLYFGGSSLFFLADDEVIVPGGSLYGSILEISALVTDKAIQINGFVSSLAYGNPKFTVFGTVDVRSVPEPGSAMLLLAGAVGLVSSRMIRAAPGKRACGAENARGTKIGS